LYVIFTCSNSSEVRLQHREKRPLALSCRSVCPPVRPSVHTEQLGSHWTDFHKILYFNICRKYVKKKFNPLNAELNPICHLLILLGDLKFMGLCIVSIFQYISNKMQRYTRHLGVRHPQHTQIGSNSSTTAADSSNGVTNTRCCRYRCMHS
jgi:hypothetical protein